MSEDTVLILACLSALGALVCFVIENRANERIKKEYNDADALIHSRLAEIEKALEKKSMTFDATAQASAQETMEAMFNTLHKTMDRVERWKPERLPKQQPGIR